MRTLRLIHAWCGAFLALLVAVIAFSGAFSAVRAEFVRLTVPAAKAPPPPSTTFGPSLTVFENDRPGEFQSVKFSPYRLGVHRVFIRGGKAAFLNDRGRVVHEWGGGKQRLEEIVLELHHTFLLGEKGRLLAGVVGLMALALVISGLILIFPIWDAVSLRIWPRSLMRRDLITAHRNLSVVIAVFLLLQVPSGLVLTFEGEIGRLAGGKPPGPPPVAPARPEGAAADWNRIIANTRQAYPQARIRRAFAPDTPTGAYRVDIARPGDINPEGSTSVYLDWQGQVLETRDNGAGSAVAAAHGVLFGLHAGSYHKYGRYLTALIGLGLGLTSLIAMTSFIRSQFPKRRPAAA